MEDEGRGGRRDPTVAVAVEAPFERDRLGWKSTNCILELLSYPTI